MKTIFRIIVMLALCAVAGAAAGQRFQAGQTLRRRNPQQSSQRGGADGGDHQHGTGHKKRIHSLLLLSVFDSSVASFQAKKRRALAVVIRAISSKVRPVSAATRAATIGRKPGEFRRLRKGIGAR